MTASTDVMRLRDGDTLPAHERPAGVFYLRHTRLNGQDTFARISHDGAVSVWGADSEFHILAEDWSRQISPMS